MAALAARTFVAKPLAARAASRRASARSSSVIVRAGRELWFPPGEAPSHLDGSLAGDFGFDPLNLGTDPDRLKWFVEAELTNGRWAMAAVAGILGQEVLGLGHWFDAGLKDYGIPNAPLLAIEFAVLGFLEAKRLNGFLTTGKSGFLDSFPFDPLNMGGSADMKLKEVKNSRLAMIAFVGFAVQAIVTRQGPLEGLASHMSNPLNYNILANVSDNARFINDI